MIELEEVKASIKKAEASLLKAEAAKDRELELKINDRLILLLEDKKRLTSGKETLFRPTKISKSVHYFVDLP